MERGRLGSVHAPGAVAGVLRRCRRRAGPRAAPAAAASTPGPAPASGEGRRRPAGSRRADPLLRGVPGPGPGPLAAPPARRGVLPRLLRAVPPAARDAGPLVA